MQALHEKHIYNTRAARKHGRYTKKVEGTTCGIQLPKDEDSRSRKWSCLPFCDLHLLICSCTCGLRQFSLFAECKTDTPHSLANVGSASGVCWICDLEWRHCCWWQIQPYTKAAPHAATLLFPLYCIGDESSTSCACQVRATSKPHHLIVYCISWHSISPMSTLPTVFLWWEDGLQPYRKMPWPLLQPNTHILHRGPRMWRCSLIAQCLRSLSI